MIMMQVAPVPVVRVAVIKVTLKRKMKTMRMMNLVMKS